MSHSLIALLLVSYNEELKVTEAEATQIMNVFQVSYNEELKVQLNCGVTVTSVFACIL